MTVEISLSVRNVIKEKFELNRKLLLKLDIEIQNCYAMLAAMKLKVTTLQLKMTALQFMHHDIMELRKLNIILHPHLKETAR